MTDDTRRHFDLEQGVTFGELMFLMIAMCALGFIGGALLF